jgi:Cytochrome c oxidase subunit Vb
MQSHSDCCPSIPHSESYPQYKSVFYSSNLLLEDSSSGEHQIIPPDPAIVHQILTPDPNKPFKIDLSKTPKSDFDPVFAVAIRDDGTIDYDKFDLTKIDLSSEVDFSPIMARAILLKPGLSLSDPFFLPPGGKPGSVPTDLEQSTGTERYELLGRLAGLDLWGMEPLPSDRMGTVDDPVIVYSTEPVHYIGCSGVPADSHDTLFMRLEMWSKHSRCKEWYHQNLRHLLTK